MPVTPLNPAGPRLLLRRMREVMASPQPPQQKLDQMVRVIANNMAGTLLVDHAADQILSRASIKAFSTTSVSAGWIQN